jgi:hypothetical protein
MKVVMCDGVNTTNQNCFWFDTSSIVPEVSEFYELPPVCPNCGAALLVIDEEEDDV